MKSDKPWSKPPEYLLRPKPTNVLYRDLRPWNAGDYREDVQDDFEYWRTPEVLASEGSAMATVAEVKENPMAGWGDWTPSGKIDQIHKFCNKYWVSTLGKVVVEVGCGGGKQLWAWDMFNNIRDDSIDYVPEPHVGGLRLFGIDHSPEAIRVAQARMPYGVRFICALASKFHYSLPVKADLVYTHTCLQHNSHHKFSPIFDSVYKALADDGILWLMNELTIDSAEYVGKYHQDVKMTPWVTDERGSHGTAAWWIGMVADAGFELLSYEKSSYIFRRI